jgi:NADPH2:quinone reductase
MHAIVVTSPGIAAWTEIDRPVPGPGQALIRVTVSGVNFMDAHQLHGGTPVKPPYAAGVEGAGVIEQLSADVADLSVGQRVAWHSGGQGSFADYAVVDAGRLVPVPDEIDDETAAALMMQGVTAHYLATDIYPIRLGDPVLVHAAAGGVGGLLTQIARNLGATVIGTASSEEKAEAARAAGANHVLTYDGFADRIRELTGGEGVAVAYDGVGAATFEGSLASLRTRGILALYGMASGPAPALEPFRLAMGGSLSIISPMIIDFTRTTKELRRRFEDLFAWTARGELTVHIGARYPVAEAAEAIVAINSRATTGKVLLTH